MTKKCFKCRKVKEIDNFYKHPQMGDGYLGKCKLCTRKDVKRRYYDPEAREKIIKYEQERFKKPERKEKVKEYAETMRKNNPGKYKARYAVSNAIRNGKMFKEPCEVCSETKVEAHHHDYRSPLKVMWLCRKHHMEVEGKQSYLL